MNVGPAEILVVAFIAFLLVGPAKLPEMARTLGQGMRELRRLQAMSQRQVSEVLREPRRPRSSTRPVPGAPDHAEPEPEPDPDPVQ